MMMVTMSRMFRITAACLALACAAWPAAARATASKSHPLSPEVPQDTGFLNRRIVLQGVTYRFQVYLPEDWRRDDGKQWPMILVLHGRGERGSEGMWQTQVGIAEAVRNHPDRWPFVIVMPQCPQTAHWTDPQMLELAMASLDQESAEFHGDPSRTYLTGLSLGGYGAWELARLHPHRWAAISIAAGGVFWSYEPDRWRRPQPCPPKVCFKALHNYFSFDYIPGEDTAFENIKELRPGHIMQVKSGKSLNITDANTGKQVMAIISPVTLMKP